VIYREILEEGEQIGIQIGEQRGEKHGRLAIVQRQLRRQFGIIPAETLERLSALSLPDLDQLSEALLDFHSMEDLIHWLKEHRPSPALFSRWQP